MLRFGKNVTIGLELNGQMGRVVCLEHSQERPRLLALDRQDVADRPPDALFSGSMIGRLIKHGNKTGRVVVNIPGSAVHLKRIQVEASEKDRLDEWVQWEAQQYLPGSPEQYCIEYQKLSSHRTDLLHVLLVAARVEDVHRRARIFHAARVHPAIMDADPLALQNSFEQNYPGFHHLPVLLTNVEEAMITLVATRSGIPEGIISVEIPPEKDWRADDVPEVVDQLKGKIQQTEDSPSTRVKMLLSGGGSRLGEVAHLFSAQEDMDIEFADPFRELAVLPDLRGRLERQYRPSEFMLVTGLALRQP
jgi:Tfp pilus assembly PilM family ATPase